MSHFRPVVIVLIILATIIFVTYKFSITPNSQILGPDSKKVEIGIYPASNKSVSTYEKNLGVHFDSVLVFEDIHNINYKIVTSYLDQGYDVVLNIEFNDSYANLKDISNGKYDKQLTDLISAIRKDGRSIWIRPLHEFNGNWYNWGVFYPGNSKSDFIPAWRHVVSVFRTNKAPVKFQLNYNRYNGKNDTSPFSDLWVGEDWVDMVVITNYNRAYTDQWHQYWHSFDEDFSPAYLQVTKLTNKPVGVAEMSSTSYGGDKPTWITDAFKDIAYKYPRITQVTWFAYNRPVNGKVWDWDLNTQAEKDAFKNGFQLLKNIER